MVMKWFAGFAVLAVLCLVGIVGMHQAKRSSSPSMPVSNSTEKIATISTGETVDIGQHLTSGTWTVVEFTARF